MFQHILDRKKLIGELKDQGKTRAEISKQLGLTLWQIDYLAMSDGRRKRKNQYCKTSDKAARIYLLQKIRAFKNRCRKEDIEDFTEEDVMKKFGKNPVCYLTGVPIDIKIPGSYQLDHIVPIKNGGKGTLDNLQITTHEANQMKNSLSVNRFIELCLVIGNRANEGKIRV